MQTESFQTDTPGPDSIIPAPSSDPGILTDTASVLAKPDSVVSTEKKDNISPVTEKKFSAGTTSIQPVKEKKITVPVADSAAQVAVMAGDSLSDTSLVVQEPHADTIKTVMVERLSGSEKLPMHPRLEENNSWIVILFLAIFSVLAWLKVSYSKRFRQFFEAFLSNRHMRQIVREEFAFSHPFTIALSLVFLVTASLLLTQADKYYQWNIFASGDSPPGTTSLLVFLKILFSLALFYFGKIVTIRLSAILFSAAEELREYLFNFFLFTNILGILLLPLTLGVAFATAIPPRGILFFSGGLALLAFLFRLVKCVYIGSLTTKISKSYIILYICTLEILPLFVVIKAFTGPN